MIEETEMHVAVIPVVGQMHVSGKIVQFGMFDNQESIRLQYVLPEYQLRDFFNTEHVVWGIGENDIILRFANGQEMKNIVANDANLMKP